MRPVRNLSDAYLNFMLRLSIATTLDMVAYADWIRANKDALSVGFLMSDEDDAAVYGRMQYTRAIGRGV